MIDYVNYKADEMPVTCKLQKLRDVQPHYHDDYVVLIYVLDGQLEIYSGGSHSKMKAGDLFFVNRREVHYTVNGSDNSVVVAHVKVQEKECYIRKKECFSEALKDLKKYLLALTYLENTERLIEESEYVKLCEKVTSLVKTIFYVKAPEKSRVDVNDVCRYLQEHYIKKFSPEKISDVLGITSIHLTNLLKYSGAGTFMEYLSYIRCREAECLLLDTNLSVQKIAGRCGFSSVQIFIRKYKTFSGRTPLQQRKYYKEISKHKFNRIKDYPSYYTMERITRCLGELCINSILDGIR